MKPAVPARDDEESSSQPSRRRRRTSSSASGTSSGGRRRRRRSSSFETAGRLEPRSSVSSRRRQTNALWVGVLGVLVVAALGFAWYLHQQQSKPVLLDMERPSLQLEMMVDPILSPLETGPAPFSSASLAERVDQFRAQREDVSLEDKDIFSTATTIAQLLDEAATDRRRHLERLGRLGEAAAGTEVEGATGYPATPRAMNESERKHLELAVTISWQRNSTAYRDRIDELWARLTQLEYGRFKSSGVTPKAHEDFGVLQDVQ